MSRLRIYAGTGRPVYDTQGEPNSNHVDRIKQEYAKGLALYVDPQAGIVRGQVKFYRQGPEQFMAAYTTSQSEDNLLSSFVDSVQRAVTETGWTVQDGVGGNQAVFDALASGAAADSDAVRGVREALEASSLPPELLRDELRDAGSFDLSVPDYETAVQALVFLRDEIDDRLRVAITESINIETIQDADVIIQPSRNVDTVSPGPELSRRLSQERTQSALDRFDRAVDDLTAALADSPTSVPIGLSAAFGRIALEDRYRLTVSPSVTNPEDRAASQWTSRAVPGGLFFGVVGAVLAITVSGPRALVDVLTSPPPFPVVGEFVPASLIIVVVSVLFGAVGLAAWLQARTERDLPTTRPASTDAVAVATTEVSEALDDAIGVVDRDTVQRRVSVSLDGFGVDVQQTGTRTDAARTGALRGLSLGLLAAAVAFGGVFGLSTIATDTLVSYWWLVVTGVLVGGLGTLGAGLAARVGAGADRSTVSLGSDASRGDQHHSSTAPTAERDAKSEDTQNVPEQRYSEDTVESDEVEWDLFDRTDSSDDRP